mmetsp:Transcript_83014/g.231735  ORF Transcript_83014/g.231735 Transcript_83014/m.231735 type:complete len:327 (+) Transcript_83014:58-1038(+)
MSGLLLAVRTCSRVFCAALQAPRRLRMSSPADGNKGASAREVQRAEGAGEQKLRHRIGGWREDGAHNSAANNDVAPRGEELFRPDDVEEPKRDLQHRHLEREPSRETHGQNELEVLVDRKLALDHVLRVTDEKAEGCWCQNVLRKHDASIEEHRGGQDGGPHGVALRARERGREVQRRLEESVGEGEQEADGDGGLQGNKEELARPELHKFHDRPIRLRRRLQRGCKLLVKCQANADANDAGDGGAQHALPELANMVIERHRLVHVQLLRIGEEKVRNGRALTIRQVLVVLPRVHELGPRFRWTRSRRLRAHGGAARRNVSAWRGT